jgi:hypothetical protein
VEHDRRYFLGGSLGERWAADRELAACVKRKGQPVLGELMFLGAQIAGVPWLPTPFRWGFGRRGASPHTVPVVDFGGESTRSSTSSDRPVQTAYPVERNSGTGPCEASVDLLGAR